MANFARFLHHHRKSFIWLFRFWASSGCLCKLLSEKKNTKYQQPFHLRKVHSLFSNSATPSLLPFNPLIWSFNLALYFFTRASHPICSCGFQIQICFSSAVKSWLWALFSVGCPCGWRAKFHGVWPTWMLHVENWVVISALVAWVRYYWIVSV